MEQVEATTVAELKTQFDNVILSNTEWEEMIRAQIACKKEKIVAEEPSNSSWMLGKCPAMCLPKHTDWTPPINRTVSEQVSFDILRRTWLVRLLTSTSSLVLSPILPLAKFAKIHNYLTPLLHWSLPSSSPKPRSGEFSVAKRTTARTEGQMNALISEWSVKQAMYKPLSRPAVQNRNGVSLCQIIPRTRNPTFFCQSTTLVPFFIINVNQRQRDAHYFQVRQSSWTSDPIALTAIPIVPATILQSKREPNEKNGLKVVGPGKSQFCYALDY